MIGHDVDVVLFHGPGCPVPLRRPAPKGLDSSLRCPETWPGRSGGGRSQCKAKPGCVFRQTRDLAFAFALGVGLGREVTKWRVLSEHEIDGAGDLMRRGHNRLLGAMHRAHTTKEYTIG